MCSFLLDFPASLSQFLVEARDLRLPWLLSNEEPADGDEEGEDNDDGFSSSSSCPLVGLREVDGRCHGDGGGGVVGLESFGMSKKKSHEVWRLSRVVAELMAENKLTQVRKCVSG